MANAVGVDGTTNSRSYADAPPAIGPSIQVTVPASLKVLVSVTAGVNATSGSTSCYMSFTGGGVTASDTQAMILLGNNLQQATASFVVTFANPGPMTLTAKYKAAPVGSCTFTNRSIFAIPLP